MIGILLALCFLVTFPLVWFAAGLDFSLFGWPFSFWMAAQGSLLVYLALVCFYAWYMNRLDASLTDSDAE